MVKTLLISILNENALTSPEMNTFHQLSLKFAWSIIVDRLQRAMGVKEPSSSYKWSLIRVSQVPEFSDMRRTEARWTRESIHPAVKLIAQVLNVKRKKKVAPGPRITHKFLSVGANWQWCLRQEWCEDLLAMGWQGAQIESLKIFMTAKNPGSCKQVRDLILSSRWTNGMRKKIEPK